MPSWAMIVLAAFVLNCAAVLATTVYLHRCATHRALKLDPRVAWVFRLVVFLATGDRVVRWVSVHRKHHAHTDEHGDPHSPYLEGFWNIQLFNVFYYFREARQIDWQKYAPDILRNEDRWDKYLFNYGNIGLALTTTGLCLLLGTKAGFTAMTLHFVSFVFVLLPLVNGLCHHRHPTGYQRTSAPHASTTYNNFLVALLTMGEGLHHNHHWQQRSAVFKRAWWEPDAGWWFIRALEAVGLASAVVRPAQTPKAAEAIAPRSAD